MQREWILQAKVEDHAIWVFYAGKWRPLRYYQGKGKPSANVIRQAKRTFRLNAGLKADSPVIVTFEWIGGEQNVKGIEQAREVHSLNGRTASVNG